MGQPAMRCNEFDRTVDHPEEPQNADSNMIPKIVLAKILGNRTAVANRADSVILPRFSSESPCCRDSGDSTKNGLLIMLELNEQKLPMHRHTLEDILVREY